MNAAVVPVAFFTPEHLSMTEGFLTELLAEPGIERVGVWHNGGDMAEAGSEMLLGFGDVYVEDAEGWRFFQMWNRGIDWARDEGADVCLVLNNDITWPIGALGALAKGLSEAPDDIAVASPDPDSDFDPNGHVDINATPAYRGLMGWCFAVRTMLWQQIDERYHTWYGDDELGLLMHEAGWRCVRARGVPVWHRTPETTMRYRTDILELRRQDEALYRSKWG